MIKKKKGKKENYKIVYTISEKRDMLLLSWYNLFKYTFLFNYFCIFQCLKWAKRW